VLGDDGVPQNAAQWVIANGFDPGRFSSNTTIGVVATNAILSKPQAKKIAAWSHDAYARTIAPAHTMFDGDTIFALATGEVEASVNLVGTLAVEVMSRAILRAASEATSAGGLQASRDIGGRPATGSS
jgi:L-aminopeptidase/D-esterase-like protein